MRFSETPVSNLAANPAIISSPTRPLGPDSEGSPASDGAAVGSDSAKGAPDANTGGDEARSRASDLIRSIGCEFSRLRKIGRSGAWADLEDKVALSGHILVPNIISAKDWVAMLCEIETFRKSEAGTAESPGDALAKWLTTGDSPKSKRTKKKASSSVIMA